MIWSRISYDGVGPLVFVEGSIDGAAYIEILKDHVYDHCLDHMGADGSLHTFMDDGASCHNSNAVIDFCASKGIQRINWPPNSPDLNPIEHVLGWMKMNLTRLKVKPRNITELKAILLDIWAGINEEYCQELIGSMPKRLVELGQANGHYVK